VIPPRRFSSKLSALTLTAQFLHTLLPTLTRNLSTFTLALACTLVAAFAPVWHSLPVLADTLLETPVQLPVALQQDDHHLVLNLKNFGDKEGFTLKTVKTERRYFFTKPKSWAMQGGTHISVAFQHSSSLLPERSSLNVLVNNRILKTIPLTKANMNRTVANIPIPLEILKDENTLTFQVDQHYTYRCEDPLADDLWTALLPETSLHLNYNLKPAELDLAKFPYPLFDPLGYGHTKTGYVVPNGVKWSSDSLSALAMVTATVGKSVSWHPSHVAPLEPTAMYGAKSNLVIVGTPSENPAINQLRLPKSLSELGQTDGLIALIHHPSFPDKVVLVVTGNTPEAVKRAAGFLAQSPGNKLMSGTYTVVKDHKPAGVHPYRHWPGFIQGTGATWEELGLDTYTTRGYTSLPILYTVKRMPDLWIKPNGKAKLRTVYSYSSQLETGQAKLEIMLNGKAIRSIPLANVKGETAAVDEVDIPVQEVFTYNDVEYRFHIFPEKYEECRFVTDKHIWGTIHNASAMSFDAEVRTPLPDIGFMNDNGYPFTAHPDLSQTLFVLPDNPTEGHWNVLLQVVNRLGRVSPTTTGFQTSVRSASTVTEGDKLSKNLVVIGGQELETTWLKQIPNNKLKVVLSGNKTNLQKGEETLSSIQINPNQGILEEVLSPWNKNRVVLFMYGTSDNAMNAMGRLMLDDRAFASIEPGNLLTVNHDSSFRSFGSGFNNGNMGATPKGALDENGDVKSDVATKSVVALKQGDARYVTEGGMDKTNELDAQPSWLKWVLYGLAFLGALSVLRGIIGGLFGSNRNSN
jgi:hypothetical protein